MGKGGRKGSGGKRIGGSGNGLCGLKSKVIDDDAPNEWTTGLFDCFHDVPVCLEGFFFPCCQEGLLLTEITQPTEEKTAWSCCGSGACAFALVMSIYCGLGVSVMAFLLRQNVRYRYSIGETDGQTFGAGCCCCFCANCQSVRELKARGHDPGRVLYGVCKYNNVEHDDTFYRMYPSAPQTRSMIQPDGKCSATNHAPKSTVESLTAANLNASAIHHNQSTGHQEMVGTGDNVAPPSNGYDFTKFAH